MSMFNPYWKCNYDQLITYYPRFYREVFEMDAILRAEGGLADGIQNGIDKMLMNCFIDGADEDTLTELEAFLGLSLLKQRTVEERRRFVKSFFAGQGKVSQTRIAEMIRAYTGADTVCVLEPFDEEGNNRLDIQFERGNEDIVYVSDIYTLLAKMLPAHIEYRPIMTYRFAVVVGKKQNINYIYDYDLCGTKPYSVLIAQIKGTEAVTRTETTNVVMEYRQSSDGGAEPQTGLYPQSTLIGRKDVIDAVTEPLVLGCGVDYIPCGTIYSGTGG